MHYYKFNIADWSLGTSHLSLEEEAIYFRLVNFYYDSEKPIPLETQSVFRRLRMGSNTESAASILTEFFEETDKGWLHSRCEKDLKEYRKTSKKNKLNGAKGGRPKKDVASSITQNKPTGLPDESQNNPNHKPLTTNHKPLTKEIKTLDQSAINLDYVFDNIWADYGKKGNRKTSKAKFLKLTDAKRSALINRIPDYVLSTPEKQYRKNLETYINQECWNDEVTTHEENQRSNQPYSAVDRVKGAIQQNELARQREEQQEREQAAGQDRGLDMVEANGDIRLGIPEAIRGDDDNSVEREPFLFDGH